MSSSRHVLGTFTLAMITVAAIISLRNLPLSAVYGWSSVFYFVAAALLFFIPIALVTAELATAWPEAGGSYIWVSEAFGKRWGFFSLWMGWMGISVWFPAILAFAAAMLAHLLSPLFPGLENNSVFYFIVMLSIFWGATFINFLGIEASGWVSTLGVLLGTVIPGILIIGLGLWWIFSGQISHIPFSMQALIPEFHLETMVLFSGILLGLVGVEVAAYHIREAKNPQKDFPKAIAIAICMILLISILGTVAVAIVVPQKEISLLSGLIQAFSVFFEAFNMKWIVPLLALFALIGSLATINTWTVGPAKGLLISARDKFLPHALTVVNKKGVPTGMLIFQAVVGTLLSSLFLWMENHSIAFWVLTALSSQFALLQYSLMFAAVLRLRTTQPHVVRPYRVPGGRLGVWSIAGIGIVTCLFGFWIVFLPPDQLNYGARLEYQLILGTSFTLLSLLPVLIALHRRFRPRYK